MYTKQPKKMLIINILDILRKYSDEDHRLTQKDIADILRRDYCMAADRKSIRRNIMNLIDFGYKIEYTEKVRNISVKNKSDKEVPHPVIGEKKTEESYIWTDFYLVRTFTNSELRLLIDNLLFSRHVPYSQCRELVQKLEGLSNNYFKSSVGYISKLPIDRMDNRQLFYNIEILDEAIGRKKMVSFKYLEYDTDKKLHIKCREDGTERIYVVSPYQMAARESKYYLICNYNKYDDISNYRIDRITDIRMLNDRAKPFSELKWANGKSLDLSEYMKRHPYMYSSEDVRVTFRIVIPMISDIIDTFGTDVRFTNKNDSGVTVSTTTNERAMLQFAKNFAPDVEILAPKSLRDKLRNELRAALDCYEK